VIGRSAAFAAVLKQAALVAPLDVTVLLTGESGTGKSQLARVIHDNSPRAARDFVRINCAALPTSLIESELFGHEKGAFTGATERRIGRFESADGGTVFLDEIGEVSDDVQKKLLCVLQEHEFERAGSNRTIKVNVRVIAATNTDLKRAVAERRFREDLFYRLQVLPLRVPSLAERREDIRELAAFFCADACERYGFPRLELSRSALRAAESAEWPGNIRQLAHALEAAAIRASGAAARQVECAHLFPETAVAEPAEPGAPVTFQDATRLFQKGLLCETLAATDWNIAEAARRLDLARAHVYNLIGAFGLRRDSR
jgi:Nif-specific regulatory protein